MNFIGIEIEGLVEIHPQIWGDERGHFFESYSARVFREHGLDLHLVQDNQSLSHKGILRGLHFQAPPFAQGKLVRVVTGAVLDVVLDIRKNSPTYGRHHKVILSSQNKIMFWIPPGFAHGFLTLEDHTIFQYKCTQYYHKESEGGILWNDPALSIDWGIDSPLLSEKDHTHPLFKDFKTPFE